MSAPDLWGFLQKERASNKKMFRALDLALNPFRRSLSMARWLLPKADRPVPSVPEIHAGVCTATGIDFRESRPLSISEIARECELKDDVAVEAVMAMLFGQMFGTGVDQPSIVDHLLVERTPAPYMQPDDRQQLMDKCEMQAVLAFRQRVPKPGFYGHALRPVIVHNIGTLLFNVAAPHFAEKHVSRANDYMAIVDMLDNVVFVGACSDDVGRPLCFES